MNWEAGQADRSPLKTHNTREVIHNLYAPVIVAHWFTNQGAKPNWTFCLELFRCVRNKQQVHRLPTHTELEYGKLIYGMIDERVDDRRTHKTGTARDSRGN